MHPRRVARANFPSFFDEKRVDRELFGKIAESLGHIPKRTHHRRSEEERSAGHFPRLAPGDRMGSLSISLSLSLRSFSRYPKGKLLPR